jgi:hypothetical protein
MTLMPAPLRRIEAEMFMDEHTARLEATVNHIQSDVTEMKADIRRVDAKIDGQRGELSEKIDQQGTNLSAKIDQQRVELTTKIDQQGATLSAKIDQQRIELTTKIDQQGEDLSAKIDQQRIELATKMDQQRKELGEKIDALAAEMRQSHASLINTLSNVKVWRWVDRTWALIVGGAILSVMARAFKWI